MAGRLARRLLVTYLVLSGIGAHLLLLGAVLVAPEKARYVLGRGLDLVRASIAAPQTPPPPLDDARMNAVVPAYVHAPAGDVPPNTVRVNGRDFQSLAEAARALKDGGEMRIGPGVYREAMILTADHAQVIGEGRVVIEQATVQGKGAILVQGDWTRIANIECRQIQVRDRNGACVRMEGSNLSLDHVYFHDSQQGLLAGGGKHGRISIRHSRFEKLGFNAGQSHGIYVGGGELVIEHSQFLRCKNEGHEIKSRAKRTFISDSLVASLDGQDSRLLDIPNGGELVVVNSTLAQGPASVNQDMIGYGLEGVKHAVNSIRLENNVILLERPAGNQLVHQKPGTPPAVIRNNLIVSPKEPPMADENTVFESREDAGMAPYPYLPLTTSDAQRL